MDASTGQLLIVLVGGIAAGAINGVVGSGTLLTYPLLLSMGLPPVLANGTNTVGLSFGGVTAAAAYREELRPRMRMLAVPTLLAMVGGIIGALLVVRLPPEVFAAVVPWLIVSAVVLVAVQPAISRRLQHLKPRPHHATRELPFWTTLVGIYAGYFGAGQGIMYMAILGLRYDDDIQQVNAAKNLFAPLGNIAAAFVFIWSGLLSWPFAFAIFAGSLVGAYYGARFARRIPTAVLRGIIIAVGLYAAGYLVLTAA